MPEYEFQRESGEVVSAFFKVDDAPEIGSWVQVDGLPARRVVSAPAARPVWTPYVSIRLPKNLKGCDCDAKGRPIIRSQQQEREVMARHGYERE